MLASWTNTPYGAGQQCPGVGVDCIRFVTAVLDRLYGMETKVPRLPQDLSLHSPAGVGAVVRCLTSRYPNSQVQDEIVCPGDVVITKIAKRSSAGHVMIVGPDPNTLWHSTQGVGVCWTSTERIAGLLRVWRSLRKSSWA